MFDPMTSDLLRYAFRVLFLIIVPLLVAVSLAGTIVAALQSATTIQEPAVLYAVRVVVVIAVLYVMFGAFSGSIVSLAEYAWTGR